MTYYLKYRPQTIDELDLGAVREQLKAVLTSVDEIPHAFLFSGPKGLGKTSAARILAKAVNCEGRTQTKGKNEIEPCNKCSACLSITQGTALDLVEIDAASNRGIDDIRALRETIKLAPSSLKYKVYVIDEVHMLTTEAFNALLKTLEEPPLHAIFILATTEPQKLPETIISRCLHLKFKKPNQSEMIRALQRVALAEKIKIEKEALALLAKEAAGSFRDGVKLLEQISFTTKEISLSTLENFLNLSGKFDLEKWLILLLNQEATSCLEMLQEALKEGIDLKWLISQSLEKLRELLLRQYQVLVNDLSESGWWTEVRAENLSAQKIIELATLLDEAGVQLKETTLPSLPLELAIMRWSGSVKKSSLSVKKENKNDPPVLTRKEDKRLKTKFEDIEKNWEKFLRALRPANSSIEALLRSTRPLRLEGDLLTIEAFYPFHKEKLTNGKCPLVIEKTIKEIFGEEIRIKCVLGEKKQPKKEESDILKEVEEIFN